MSRSITIRDVPDEVRSVLAARAAATGRSLQDYLLLQLERLAARPDAEAWAAQVRVRVARGGSHLSAAEVLAHRDAERL